ncbi:hemagglutinin protein [Chitinophaga sp. G-6-1-13]|uniref:Hemagglutinin protein n=1 Tax=Chitinophaga fulva TaxID=2728842 RepID=A0A848GHR0_9BACT|nr:hemagglutinin protein [Chitinophaga fulva]NML37736.1 hemagglutinin protein [Chitinophaga fulva]
MSAPVFNQVGSLLLYELSTLPIGNAPDYWAGYFATTSSNLGANASTTAVWQDVSGGFYLFLDKKPADFALFVQELEQLRPSLGPPNVVRFVWIMNADKPYLRWQTTSGLAEPAGSAPDITWTLTRTVSFLFGAYQLTIAGLNALTYIADANGGGIQFTTGGSLDGPEGGYAFGSATMSFTGPALGAFNSEMNIPRPSNPDFAGVWSALNIGLLYGAAPTEETDLPDSDYTQMVFMPVFNRQKDTLNLGLLFDPLYLQEPSRTALSLFPPGGNASLILDSYLRTTRGYTIQLTPLAGSGAIPDARFVIGACPVQTESPDAGLRYHFSPDGAFQVTVKPPENASASNTNTVVTDQLLLGLSGLEYANLGNSNYMIAFEGGKPAYIPPPGKNKNVAPNVAEALTDAATTSHLTVLAVNNQGTRPVYFAQPQQAPVFSNREQRADNVLDYNPIPAYTLYYNAGQRPPVFPSGVYAGLAGTDVLVASGMENASLAPYRSYCLGKDYGTPPNNEMPSRRIRAVNDPLGVTPQGMVAELTPDYNDYDGLILGNMPGTEYPRVDLSAVQGKFKQVLQSNQLFFVAANVDELMMGTSVRYMLTDGEKPYLLAMGVPQNIIDAVYQTLVGKTQPFETEKDFVACIGTAATVQYLPDFLKIAGILKVEMDGWVFQLSPRSWRTDAASPTIMIGKFCNRTLLDLANDTSSWLWPEVAVRKDSTLAATQAVLVNMFKAAAEPDASDALKLFYNTVVNDPNWNGFLFLNAPTDIAEMPDELKFLTAGIDLKQFYAHHIGFSQTPFSVENGMPKLEQTAAFGLINYNDPVDLYSDETIPFGFKTMILLVRFANAALADFSAQVELMLNQMLGTPLSKQIAARGNNLIIDGSYQRVGGAPSYSFALTGENVFLSSGGSALTSIEVLSVQLVNGGNKANPTEVLTTFILSGNLKFVLIEGFDLFSFGPGEDTNANYYLRYSGLSIDMQFLMTAPGDQTFTVREANTAFDMTASLARPSSLINNFPLTVSALIASPDLSEEGDPPSGQTPEDMGYTSVSAPIDQTPMKPSWYGLVFTLDLGTFGALTGSVSFKISILAAWSLGGGADGIAVYMGLKLPGINAIAGSFPVQGVLKIGFRNFQFETYQTKDNKLGYLLRLRNFSVSVLLWSFPPGNNNIILFGQPGNPKGSLGWYAAYDSGTNKKPNAITDPVQRRLETGRRTPPVA